MENSLNQTVTQVAWDNMTEGRTCEQSFETCRFQNQPAWHQQAART